MEHGIIGRWWWIPALVAVVGVLVIVGIFVSHITQVTHGSAHMFKPNFQRCVNLYLAGKSC